jgi:hypothetical protein
MSSRSEKMANVVKVTFADQSKNGKRRVYFDGKNGWKDAFYVGNDCAAPPVGATIDVEVSSKDFTGRGNLTWFLNGWKIVPPANGVAPQQEAPKPIIPTHEGWEIPGMNAAQLVSNVLATAITAGLIKYPGDLGAWSNAAQGALHRLRDGKFEAQDVVNGSYTEQDPSEPQGFPEDEFDGDDKIPF